MSTFVDHGLMGAVLYAGAARLLSLPEWIVWTLFAWGFIEGAWPDMYPFLLNQMDGDGEYWYAEYHLWPPAPWKYMPAFLLHVKVVDPIDHKYSPNWFWNGPGWLRGLAVLECLVEVGGVVAVALT